MTTMYAILLMLLSALAFAVTFVLVRVGVRSASSGTALWVTLTINAIVLWGWSLIAYGPQFDHWWEWRYFMLAGLFAPLLGRLFQFQGMARLGANITTPLTLTHPVVTVILAILFLGEDVTYLGLLGALLVVLGSIAIGSEGGKGNNRSLSSLPRSYLALPLLASLSYGISMVFRKVGIHVADVDAVTASAVTMTTSWLLATLYLLATRSFGTIRCNRRESVFFLIAGIVSSFGPVFAYAALPHAGLVVLAPVAATTPLFVLVVSYMFIRADEIFTPRVVLGTMATVAGVILVTAYGLA